MAKKVVISDLVVKVGIESKATERKLKDFDRKLKKTTKGQTKETEKQARTEKKAADNAQAWLKRSREFYKLRKADGKSAKRIEGDLIKAYIKGDKVRQAGLKRQVSDRMEAFRQESAQEVHKERQYKKSMRARMLMRKRAYKDQSRQNKLAEEERKRQARHNKEMQRQARRTARDTFEKSGNLAMGVGMGVVGGTGLAAGAGYAATKALQSTASLRSSETAYRIALRERGQEGNFEANRQRLYKTSAALNLDPQQVLSEIAMNLESLPTMTTDAIQKMVLGLGAYGKTFGVAPEALTGAMQGFRQFASGATDWENVKQMFENLGPMLGILSNQFGMSREQFMQAGSSGNLKGAIAKAGGLDKVVAGMSQEVYAKGVSAYTETIGTLPQVMGQFSVLMQHMERTFGAGMEQGGIVGFITELTNVVAAHQEDFRTAGKYFGEFIQAVGQVVTEDLLPMMTGMNDSLKDMTPKERIQMFRDNLESIGAGLKLFLGAVIAFKAVTSFTAIIAFFSALKTITMGIGVSSLATVATSLTGILAAVTAFVTQSGLFGKGDKFSAENVLGKNASWMDASVTEIPNMLSNWWSSPAASAPSLPTPTPASGLGLTGGMNNSNNKTIHVHGDMTKDTSEYLEYQGFLSDTNPLPFRN